MGEWKRVIECMHCHQTSYVDLDVEDETTLIGDDIEGRWLTSTVTCPACKRLNITLYQYATETLENLDNEVIGTAPIGSVPITQGLLLPVILPGAMTEDELLKGPIIPRRPLDASQRSERSEELSRRVIALQESLTDLRAAVNDLESMDEGAVVAEVQHDDIRQQVDNAVKSWQIKHNALEAAIRAWAVTVEYDEKELDSGTALLREVFSAPGEV